MDFYVSLLIVCEWIGPGDTSINSGKNAFNPYTVWKLDFWKHSPSRASDF